MSDEFDWTDELLGNRPREPRFPAIRARACQQSTAVEDLLRSDWRAGTSPTEDQAERVGDARHLIAAAKKTLLQADA